jgi:hypothetical protein
MSHDALDSDEYNGWQIVNGTRGLGLYPVRDCRAGRTDVPSFDDALRAAQVLSIQIVL